MNKKSKSIYITLSVLILSIAVSYVDAIIKPNYWIKIIIKMIAYLLVPMSYFLINKEEFKEFKKMFIPNKKDFQKTTTLSITIYITLVAGYFLLRNIIDFSNVTDNLTNNMGITLNNFLYVTIYIAFINSFCEEFFYRGYSFITLKKHTNRIFAYIFSSTLFAIYHIGMLLESFETTTLFLAVIGLFVGGCIFSYLNEKSNNIYPSWIVHMFTNFGINTIGFILFTIA